MPGERLVNKKMHFYATAFLGNTKKKKERGFPKKGCFAHRCKVLSGMPATLPCKVVPSTHDALINISYSSCSAVTMEDEKGERERKCKAKKKREINKNNNNTKKK